jgi:protein-disulfide isomerase-like protein with CxxC motif
MQSALWSGIWPQGPGNANREKATAEAVEAMAGTIGLNVEQFKADLNGPECQTWLQQSGRTLQKFGVGGTPSFFVNGKPAQAGDLDSFKKLVDAEIKAANDSGIPAAEYYDKAIIAKGKKEAVMISPFDE